MRRKRVEAEEQKAAEEARKAARGGAKAQKAQEESKAKTMPVPKKATNNDKTLLRKAESGLAFSLAAADLKQQSLETLTQRRLGETQDSVLQAAIKAKALDSAIFLKQAAEFPLCYQNGIGNTMLHNAITTGDLRFVKLVVTENLEDTHLIDASSLADIRGNYRQGLTKCLVLRNMKGFTPFSQAIESGNKEVFRLVLEIYLHTQAKNP